MSPRSVIAIAARLACVAGLAALAGGCAAGSGSAAASAPDTRPLRASLVMPGPDSSALPAGDGAARPWEYGRNDYLMGGAAPANRPDVAAVTVIRRDRQWTVNGRPVESTYTSTTSIQWRTGP